MTLESSILNETRQVNIYLPTSYSHSLKHKYPVIYLLDGSKDEDFIHVSGLVQFCSFSWINIIPESIVVGIANIDRRRDFTYPSSNPLDTSDFPTSGKSEAFIQFLKNEIQPLIKDNYRVEENSTLIGQSLGGLLATEILFKHSEMFDNYIITSPSLWWDSENLLNYEMKGDYTDKSIYIAVGKEGPVMERIAKSLHTKVSRELQPRALYFQFFEDQNHGDALHLAVYDAFEKLFKS